MSSLSQTSERAIPQQKRASRRIETFLEEAEKIISEVGYDAATMTAIAERSGASIGALYRYFPDKVAVARALLVRYSLRVESDWSSLSVEATRLNEEEFADLLVERMIVFSQRHPAYLPLITASVRFVRDAPVRKKIREQFARAFIARNPGLSSERAFLIANIAVYIMKGLIEIFASSPAGDHAAITAEIKKLLAAYLKEVLR